MNEPWREVADRIWNSDRKRFKNLYAWILIKERRYTPVQIRDVLILFEATREFAPLKGDWWPYLTKTLRERVKRSTSQAFVAKHEQIKKEEAEWGKKLKRKLPS